MQQRGNHPLSDGKSAFLAVEYVEKIWDRYLETYAKSACCSTGIHLVIGQGWYEYDYSLLAGTLEKISGSFYGDHCGTRLLDTNRAIRQARRFEGRSQHDLLLKAVTTSGAIFCAETGCLPSPPPLGEMLIQLKVSRCLEQYPPLGLTPIILNWSEMAQQSKPSLSTVMR